MKTENTEKNDDKEMAKLSEALFWTSFAGTLMGLIFLTITLAAGKGAQALLWGGMTLWLAVWSVAWYVIAHYLKARMNAVESETANA